MANYAVVLTTYAWDLFVNRQCRLNAAQVDTGDFYVLVDTTRGPVHIPNRYNVVSIDPGTISRMGLVQRFNKALFWHNLDYLFIYFYTLHREYDYYIFLDYDALLDVEADSLVSRLRADRVDLLANPIRTKIEDWVYTRQHRREYPVELIQAYELFIVALSNRALAHLLRRRQQLSTAYRDQEAWFWPFCEAFVPTELAKAGFKIAPLSAYGSVERCTWWPPILETSVPAKRPAGFLHPVLDGPRYARSILRHSPNLEFFHPRSRLWCGLRQLPVKAYLGPLIREIVWRFKAIVLHRLRRAAPPADEQRWN